MNITTSKCFLYIIFVFFLLCHLLEVSFYCIQWGAAPMAASQVTPAAAPVGGPTPAAPAGFTAPSGTTDQDWNMAGGTTTDWGAEDGGDWGSTEPKVSSS